MSKNKKKKKMSLAPHDNDAVKTAAEKGKKSFGRKV